MTRWLVLAAALLLPTLAWSDAGGDGEEPPRSEAAEPMSDAQFLARLRVLQRRRAMLAGHQVLAGTASILAVSAGGFSLAHQGMLSGGLYDRSSGAPLVAVQRGLSLGTFALYYSGATLAWAMPSPSGLPQHKGISPYKTGRDDHIALSILHGVLMGASVGLGAAQTFGPASAHDGLGWAQGGTLTGAGVVMLIAAVVVDQR